MGRRMWSRQQMKDPKNMISRNRALARRLCLWSWSHSSHDEFQWMDNLEGKGGHGIGGKCFRDKSVDVMLILMPKPYLT